MKKIYITAALAALLVVSLFLYMPKSETSAKDIALENLIREEKARVIIENPELLSSSYNAMAGYCFPIYIGVLDLLDCCGGDWETCDDSARTCKDCGGSYW